MRFQREVMFAKSSKGFVYIIPSDDNRIKFVVTPYLGASQPLVDQIQENLQSMSE